MSGLQLVEHDRGDAMVVWCMLLAVMLLPLGGLSIDLWHGIAVQRQLQAAAEDAAAAGSSGVDVVTYRDTGCIALDPSLAARLAEANLAAQSGLGSLSEDVVTVSPDGSQISVTLAEQVHLTLLSIVQGDRPLTVRASASSAPKGSASTAGEPCDETNAGGTR